MSDSKSKTQQNLDILEITNNPQHLTLTTNKHKCIHSYFFSDNNIPFNTKIDIINNELHFTVESHVNKKFYEKFYSLEQLMQINKVFRMYDKIEDCLEYFDETLNNTINSPTISIKDDFFILFIKINVNQLPKKNISDTIKLEIPFVKLFNQNQNESINSNNNFGLNNNGVSSNLIQELIYKIDHLTQDNIEMHKRIDILEKNNIETSKNIAKSENTIKLLEDKYQNISSHYLDFLKNSKDFGQESAKFFMNISSSNINIDNIENKNNNNEDHIDININIDQSPSLLTFKNNSMNIENNIKNNVNMIILNNNIENHNKNKNKKENNLHEKKDNNKIINDINFFGNNDHKKNTMYIDENEEEKKNIHIDNFDDSKKIGWLVNNNDDLMGVQEPASGSLNNYPHLNSIQIDYNKIKRKACNPIVSYNDIQKNDFNKGETRGSGKYRSLL